MAVHATAQSIDASGIFHATLSDCGQHTLPSSLAPPGHQERVLTSRGCLLSAQMAREHLEPIRAPISTASCSQCEYTATCNGLASASAAATPTVAATQRNAAPAEAYLWQRRLRAVLCCGTAHFNTLRDHSLIRPHLTDHSGVRRTLYTLWRSARCECWHRCAAPSDCCIVLSRVSCERRHAPSMQRIGRWCVSTIGPV